MSFAQSSLQTSVIDCCVYIKCNHAPSKNRLSRLEYNPLIEMIERLFCIYFHLSTSSWLVLGLRPTYLDFIHNCKNVDVNG